MYKTFILLLKVTILICLFNFTSEEVFSQCYTQFTTQNPATTLSIPVNSGFQTISNCMKGGNYAVCNVVEGYLYTWTTCLNSSNFNSQLTLFQGQGCSSASYLAYNDNSCNSGARIIWKATFTGLVTVLLNKKNCKTTQIESINLSWESVFSDCNNPLQLCTGNSIFPATTLQPSPYDPSTPTNWGCGSNQTINNQTWYSFKISVAGQINLNISSTVDVDGLVWGPFDNLNQSCQSASTNPVSCDFNAALSFPLGFFTPVSSVGKYYMVMISNSTNQLANINFSFNNSAGKIELCSPILSYNQPLCLNENLQLFAFSNESNANYYWTGPDNFTSNIQNPIINNVTLINSGIYTCNLTTTYGISTINTINVEFLPKPLTSDINHY